MRDTDNHARTQRTESLRNPGRSNPCKTIGKPGRWLRDSIPLRSFLSWSALLGALVVGLALPCKAEEGLEQPFCLQRRPHLDHKHRTFVTLVCTSCASLGSTTKV
jgi:hypothetical protein